MAELRFIDPNTRTKEKTSMSREDRKRLSSARVQQTIEKIAEDARKREKSENDKLTGLLLRANKPAK